MAENIEIKFRKKLNSYSEISEESFQKLLAISSEMQVRKDEILLLQGFVCKQIYFLASGYMIACINNDEGHSYNKNIFMPRDLVTSTVSAILQKPSEFTLQAITNCTLISLSYKNFRQLIFDNDDLKVFISLILNTIGL